MLTAGIVLSLIGGIFENFSDIRWTLPGIGAVLYLGVIGSAVAFTLYMWVIKRVTPLTASVGGRDPDRLAGAERADVSADPCRMRNDSDRHRLYQYT